MSVPAAYLLDTNIVLRYLMNDHPEHSRAAKKLIENAGNGKVMLHLPFIAITEIIFTLQKFYGVAREDIGRELMKVLTAPGVKLAGPSWVLQAVEEYGMQNVSFGDACLAAEARAEKLAIASFDRGIDALPGVRRYEPG
jgi:predicted nucleic acid-binding protein